MLGKPGGFVLKSAVKGFAVAAKGDAYVKSGAGLGFGYFAGFVLGGTSSLRGFVSLGIGL